MLPLGSMIALPFAGWIVSKMGSRIITFISSLLYIGILLLLGYSNTVVQLSTLLFFFGFWGDVLNIAMNTQAIHLQQDMYQKPLMSSFHGMWSLGAMTGAIMGGVMMKAKFGTVEHFWMAAAVIVSFSVLFFFYLIPTDRPRTEEQKLFAWPDKALLLLGAICFCCALCEGAMADWSSLYYKQSLEDMNRVSTTGYTAFALMMALGRLVGDKFTAQLGYRKILMVDSLVLAIGLSVAIFIKQPIFVIIGFGLVGLGVSTIIPIIYSLSGKAKTMATSAALAAVSTVGFTGFLIGPPIIGLVAHEVSLRWALLILLFLALVIFGLARNVKD